MPTDLKNYIDNNRKEQEDILESILASAKGNTATSKSMGVYVSGAIAALVAAVAVAL